jgi:hypothetical protein
VTKFTKAQGEKEGEGGDAVHAQRWKSTNIPNLLKYYEQVPIMPTDRVTVFC